MSGTITWQNGRYELFKGDDLRIIFTVRNKQGQLVNISGAQNIRFAIAPFAGGAPLLNLSMTGGSVTRSNNNAFFVQLTRQQTAALPANTLHMEAEIIASNGRSYTVVSAPVLVKNASLLP